MWVGKALKFEKENVRLCDDYPEPLTILRKSYVMRGHHGLPGHRAGGECCSKKAAGARLHPRVLPQPIHHHGAFGQSPRNDQEVP
ncbi:hypothetical protein PSEUDO8Z_10441 [Pseudomonas sp. 8Z]|nr:hypothetical protein PSEUDO8Z_10441 [Pseudomonas sp. 8Z]